jgi:uncharacterized membrane protein YbaN (DUF454 family)
MVAKILRITVGVIVLLIGIAGLLLPFLQGILTILLALLILSYDIPYVRRLMKRLRERFPRHGARLRREESRMILRWRKFIRFFSRKRGDETTASEPRAANPNGKTSG